MDSGDSSGIVMRNTRALNPSSDTQTMVSDFDASFANRDKQLTPEHQPLRIKNINTLSSELGNS